MMQRQKPIDALLQPQRRMMWNPFRYPHDPFSWAAWCGLFGMVASWLLATFATGQIEREIPSAYAGAVGGALLGYFVGAFLNRLHSRQQQD
jgi:membrane associated rhomboid family serine protease